MDFKTEKLSRSYYDLNDPLQAAKLQQTALIFMENVRENKFFGSVEGNQLMDDFCALISDKHTWHLVTIVVPEFRSAPRTGL